MPKSSCARSCALTDDPGTATAGTDTAPCAEHSPSAPSRPSAGPEASPHTSRSGTSPAPDSLLDRLAERDIEVLLPVLGPHLARSWGDFRGSRDLAERAPGRPPEPSGDALPAEAITRADALIIPALAVDRGGRRLGQGGGWYDRMLPLRRDDVIVFAMVYDDELVPGPLPTEPHDEIVDAVITPDAWFLLEGSAFAAGS